LLEELDALYREGEHLGIVKSKPVDKRAKMFVQNKAE
jgi:hypothetical protein